MGNILSIFRSTTVSTQWEKVLFLCNACGISVFAFWLIPYSFVVKQKIITAWFNSRFSVIEKRLAYPVAAVFLACLAFEISSFRQRQKKWKVMREVHKEKTGEGGNNDPDSTNLTVSLASAERAVNTVFRMLGALSGFFLMLFVHRASYLAHGTGLSMLVSLEETNKEREMVKFQAPSLSIINMITAPFRSVFDPVFLGAENIPEDRPLLFISNHTLMAFDFPLLLWYLRKKKNIYLRALGDHSHFEIPAYAEFMSNWLGVVDGTRKNFDLMLSAKQCMMIYPGNN